MDPITSAIVAALAAGVTASAGKVGEGLIVEAYQALKAAIKQKLGMDSEAAKAVDSLEAKPDSEGRKATLQEEIKAAGADQDAELKGLARNLTVHMNMRSDVEHVHVTVTGNRSIVAYGNSTVNATYGMPIKV